MNNKNKSLNALMNEYQKIESQIIENEGEINDSMDELISENNADIESKFNNYERFTRYLNGQIEHLKKMEAHYAKRRKILENSVNKLRTNLVEAIKITGEASIKTSEFNFTLCKSEKWTVNAEEVDDNLKAELIQAGMAEEIFKPHINKIKAEYKAELSKPSWIQISESDFIKVS